MDKSGEYYERSKKVTPAGVSSPVRAFRPNPIFFKKGKGCRLTDVDGKEYIDFCLSYGPMIVGHAHPRVVKAVEKQMKRGSVYGAPSVPELDLLERVCKDMPNVEMARLVNSGTEATMHAIRLARGFTGKNGIIKMDGGFHGAHDAALVKAGSGATEHGTPSSSGVPKDIAKHTYSVEYNDEATMEAALENEDIAAVIMEPVLGNIGPVLPRKGYLEKVRSMTQKNGVVLIFDEVITGYRLGPGGAQELYGIKPDLTTTAKIVGGGLPLGVFGGRKDMMELISPLGPVYQAGTFSGNPLSAAAGLETIEIMSEDENYAKLWKSSDEFASGLADALEDSGGRGVVQSLGPMFQIFFGVDSVGNNSEAMEADRETFGKFMKSMHANGVYIPPSQFETNFISIAHGEKDLGKAFEIYSDCIAEAVR